MIYAYLDETGQETNDFVIIGGHFVLPQLEMEKAFIR
jgi:hypothetical protein